jgi:SAM-dependent methyltransferase
MSPSTADDCPLCHHQGRAFFRDEFFICRNCGGIFRARRLLPGPDEERARYEKHRNDARDPGYRRFVSPVTAAVMKGHPPSSRGLDFGAGTGSAVSSVLEEAGYDVRQYDPFFQDRRELLAAKYDFIACCEVTEHFHDPDREFKLLKGLLKPGGRLYCMTHLYDDSIDFGRWYYREDITHVFFYQVRTMELILDRYGFSSLRVDGRLVELSN